MSLLVVGSVAFDAVETPFGKCEKMLGGSASHFSISASYFTDVSIVGVVGAILEMTTQSSLPRTGSTPPTWKKFLMVKRSAGLDATITT